MDCSNIVKTCRLELFIQNARNTQEFTCQAEFWDHRENNTTKPNKDDSQKTDEKSIEISFKQSN